MFTSRANECLVCVFDAKIISYMYMNTQKPDCPFCLTNNLLETPIIAETTDGFLTISKSHPQNYLAIPRVHVERIVDLPDDWMRDFKQLIMAVPDLEDFNISLNKGKHAGQTVEHLHFWIIPRADDKSSGKGLATLIPPN